MSEKKERIFVCDKDNITRYENNLVTLTLQNGEVFEKLEPRRLFPVSRIDTYITLLNENGSEGAVIRDYKCLNNESSQIIKESINDYYLVPYISKIISITEKSGTLIWNVDTNRGAKRFEIRDRNHDIRVYKDGKIRIRDSHDNRYVIEDYRALDKHSKSLLIGDL